MALTFRRQEYLPANEGMGVTKPAAHRDRGVSHPSSSDPPNLITLLDPAYYQNGQKQKQKQKQKQNRPSRFRSRASTANLASSSRGVMVPPADSSRHSMMARLGPRPGQELSRSERQKACSLRNSKFSRSPHDEVVDVDDRPDPPAKRSGAQQQMRHVHSKESPSQKHQLERSSPLSRSHVKPSDESHVTSKSHRRRRHDLKEQHQHDRSRTSKVDGRKSRPDVGPRRRRRQHKVPESPIPPASASQRPREGEPCDLKPEQTSPPRRHRRHPAKSSSFQSRPEQLLQVYRDLARQGRLDDLAALEESQGSGQSGISSLVIYEADDDDDNNSLDVLSDDEVSLPEDVSLGHSYITASTPVTTNIHPDKWAREVGTYRRHESSQDDNTLATACCSMASMVAEEFKFGFQDSGEYATINQEVHKMGARRLNDSMEDIHTLATAASSTSMVTERLASSLLTYEFGSPVQSIEASSEDGDESVDQVDGCFKAIEAHIETGADCPNQDFGALETPSFRLLLLEKQIKYLQHEPTPLGVLPPPSSMQQLMILRRNCPPRPTDIVEETLKGIRRRRDIIYGRNGHSSNPRKNNFGHSASRRLTI